MVTHAKRFGVPLLVAALLSTGCLGPLSGLQDDPSSTAPQTNGTANGSPADAGEDPSTPARSPGSSSRSNEADGNHAVDESDGGFSDTHVFPGDYQTGGNYSHVLREGPHDVQGYSTHTIESPVDGTSIWMGIVRPEVPNGTEVPIILVATPYLQQMPFFTFSPPEPRTVVERQERDHFHVDMLVDNYVPHGYAVALLSLRGTGHSGGCWDTLGPKTGADLDRAASWLANRSWSNGNIGAFGISQDAAAAWQLAATGNPHVETIVPAAGWSDHYGLVFRNGSTSIQGLTFWSTVLTGTYYTEAPESLDELEAMASRAECPEAARGFSATTYALAQGADDPFGYWAERDHRSKILANYDGSVYRIQGLDDSQIPASATQRFVDRLVEDPDVEVKQLIGPWGHRYPDNTDRNPTPRWDFAEILLHWFDYWLKDDRTRDLGPRVQVADQQGHWRSAHRWPAASANRTVLHPAPNGTLAEQPSERTAERVVGPNAGRLTRLEQTTGESLTPCSTCAVFQTQPLDSPLRFAGAPNAHLAVTPTAPGGFLTADLYVIDANGSASHLTTTHMDLRFHDGGRDPELLTPGEKIVAEMELEPTDALVPEEGKLRLVVGQGSDAHSLYRNGGRWGSVPTQPPDPVVLHVGGEQSTLSLTAFEPRSEAFFEPP